MKQVGKYWVPDHETLQIEALSVGGWQLDHLDRALSHVKDRRVAIDGGAHIGSWTFAMLERGFAHVQAFEPADDTFECLLENAKEWRIKHMADVESQFIGLHRCALGAEAGRTGMKDDGKYAGGNTGGRYLKGDGPIAVRALDVYKFVAVDFIKLDVEGYEPFALRGARDTIERCKPVILIEEKHRMAHRFGYAPGEASRMLQSFGMVEIDLIGSDHIFGWPAP